MNVQRNDLSPHSGSLLATSEDQVLKIVVDIVKILLDQCLIEASFRKHREIEEIPTD